MNIKTKISSVVFVITMLLFIVTFSIGLPIYCRPFYYAHITPLDLEEKSGYSREEIVDAYNEVLDYLTLPEKNFGTGVMKYSSEGYSHFADCKGLFTLNAVVLLMSSAIIITILILRVTKRLGKMRLGSLHPAFYSGLGAILIPSILGLLISLDFNRAFVIFHKIFFPGKTNWTFDPRTDEIIRVLPQVFFRNCAILIGSSVLVLGALCMIIPLIQGRREKVQNK